jgi:hypothetical protein
MAGRESRAPATAPVVLLVQASATDAIASPNRFFQNPLAPDFELVRTVFCVTSNPCIRAVLVGADEVEDAYFHTQKFLGRTIGVREMQFP